MKHITVLYKILSVLLLGFIAVATLHAQAPTELNINSASITIPGAPNTQEYIISGNGTATSNTITIESGYVGTITLKNVKITRTGQNSTTASCITVKGRYFTNQTTMTEDTKKSNLNPLTLVNFILDGTNELLLQPNNTGSSYISSVYCALQVDRGAQIHISAKDPNDNASGILIAKSTSKQPGETGRTSGNAGAGIGSRNYGNSGTQTNQGKVQVYNVVNSVASEHSERYASGGNVIISSGTITAWGGHGAGIGGGWYTFYDGIIVIYGGIINARTGTHSAGVGSGCPNGSGVQLQYYADNSMIIALPPSEITAFGGESEFRDLEKITAAELERLAKLGLNGSQTVAYMNDPNKPHIQIHTEDNEPGANIYLDLSETIVKGTTTLEDIFTSLGISYDLKKVKIGKTNSAGTDLEKELHGQFDQPTTFFTDASSSNPTTLGRPYMPVRRTVTAAAEIILELLKMNISFKDHPSTPLHEGYTTTQARQNAHMIEMRYDDQETMNDLSFRLQSGGVDFKDIIFLGSDGVSEVTKPTTLSQGDKYFIVLPIQHGRPIGIYSDVLLIGGKWGTMDLPGYIRRIGEQRVVKNDTGVNDHIKVTASPNKFVDNTNPTTQTVTLTLNIDHTGTGVLYDPSDVKAKYLITTEADYDNALAATPLNSWDNLNIPAGNGQNQTTTVSFSSKPRGIYYIHWYAESGVVYAHSQTVTNPPHQYGGFGPYILTETVKGGRLSGNPSVCKDQIPSVIIGAASTGGSGNFSYQWQMSTNGTNWTNVGGNTQNYTPTAALTASPTYFQRITTDVDYGGTTASDNVFAIYIVSDGLTLYWKQGATNNNWNDPANWVDAAGVALNMVPVSCSNVYIPGGATNYPSLHPDKSPEGVYGPPVCQNITFAYGAELAYQHKLTYEKAHVQYNWGYYGSLSGVNHGDQPTGNDCSPASVKKRDIWYALAAPLKSMATGDFAFAGYPLTWQAGFALSDPHTGLKGSEIEVGDFDKKFATNDVPLTETNNAIAIKVALYKNTIGCDDHCNLDGLKGVIEIPYFENTAKAAYYPGHTYDRFTKESKFFYFNPQTLQLLHSPVGKMKRSDEAYRFVYEEGGVAPNIVIGTSSTVPGYKQKVKRQNSTSMKVMIGNPFMASIDAKRFFDVNNDNLLASEGYQVFDSENHVWNHYTLASAGNIPPLHAFIVTLKSNEVDLLFPLEGTYALTAGASTRRSIVLGSLEGGLYMKSVSNSGLEGDYSVLMASKAVDVNVKKMIHSEGHATPETFFIAPDDKNYNLIQAYEEGIQEIGIGVKSSDIKSSQLLTFENVNEFSAANGLRPVLIDKHLGVKQDLTLNNMYPFTQRQMNADNQYIDSNRFVLQLSAIDGVLQQGKDISIVYANKLLEVKSSKNITQIQIYDTLGRQIYSEVNINTDYYTKSLPLSQGVYIVKVYTENGTKADKIMAL